MVPWGFDMWDLSNQFVAEGVSGGLVTFLCFIAMISICFSRLGTARKSVEGDRNQGFYWFLGCKHYFRTLFAFFGISYFDHTQVAWFALAGDDHRGDGACVPAVLEPASRETADLARFGIPARATSKIVEGRLDAQIDQVIQPVYRVPKSRVDQREN